MILREYGRPTEVVSRAQSSLATTTPCGGCAPAGLSSASNPGDGSASKSKPITNFYISDEKDWGGSGPFGWPLVEAIERAKRAAQEKGLRSVVVIRSQ